MKKRNLLVAALSMFTVFGFGVVTMTGCNGQGQSQVEKFDVTWTVPEHATVVVDDYDSLPVRVDDGTRLTFAVNLDQGYSLESVKANDKRVTAKSGKYTVAVTKATEIVIEVGESVTALTITQNPDKLSYIAGEELDTTGMVVQATYATGRSETIQKGDNGYSVYPTVFEGGEDHFEVSYGGLTQNVNLDGTVEYLVTIDPNGGTISNEYLSNLEAKNLHNYNVSDAGTVTFTYYNNLSGAIELPTKDQISKVDNTLTGWSNDGEAITNSTAANVTARAQWQVQLVEIEEATLVVEDNVPYLVLTGLYRAAEEVNLHLHEGNKNIDLDGPTFTGASGAPLNVKFNLKTLSDMGGDYEGAWMDITFIATYQGQRTVMDVVVNNITVDMNSKIKVGLVVYQFASYQGYLKVYFSNTQFVWNLSFSGTTLIMNGQTSNTEWYGKHARSSAWIGNETQQYGGLIASDGTFTINFELGDAPLNTDGYFHMWIYESADDNANRIWPETGEKNVLIAEIDTPIFDQSAPLGNSTPLVHTKYVGSDGYSYYIGHRWEGLMVYKVDESKVINMSNAYLTLEDGKVYYNVTGNCGPYYTSETFLYGFYFQHNSNIDGLGYDDVYDNTDVDQHAVVSGGTFTIKVCVSDALSASFLDESNAASRWGLTAKFHIGDNTTANLIEIKPSSIGTDSFTLNGVTYSLIMNSSTWNIAALVLEKSS